MSLAEKLDFHSMPEPNSGCQLWLGTKGPHGHGQLYCEGTMQGAHRLAWRVANGPIPRGMHVCHKCDNPYCINPAHLFLGTHQDNMDDMILKGRDRKARGERAGKARLTEEDVKKIRADKRHYRVVAAEYGVGRSTIYAIWNEESWSHI